MKAKSRPSDRTKAREYKRALANLTAAVTFLLTLFDEVMKQPKSRESGKKIAGFVNDIEIHNGLARQVLARLRSKK